MTLDGREVANFVLDVCDESGIRITNLSLQKIVYFCHVWSMVKFQAPLIRHQFEAWQLGPVLPYLYREFSEFGEEEITKRSHKMDAATGRLVQIEYNFDEKTKRFLEKVIHFYSRISPYELVELTHLNGGPWEKVWNSGSVQPGMKISNKDIVDFYSRVPGRYIQQ